MITTAHLNYIEQQGYKELPEIQRRSSSCRSFYKKYSKVEPSCYCNERGIQLVLSLYEYYYDAQHHSSWELDLTAECDDGKWVKLSAYSLGLQELETELEPQSQKLIRAWQSAAIKPDRVAANKIPPPATGVNRIYL